MYNIHMYTCICVYIYIYIYTHTHIARGAARGHDSGILAPLFEKFRFEVARTDRVPAPPALIMT